MLPHTLIKVKSGFDLFVLFVSPQEHGRRAYPGRISGMRQHMTGKLVKRLQKMGNHVKFAVMSTDKRSSDIFAIKVARLLIFAYSAKKP